MSCPCTYPSVYLFCVSVGLSTCSVCPCVGPSSVSVLGGYMCVFVCWYPLPLPVCLNCLIRVLVCLAVRISVYLSARLFCTFRRLPNRGLASQRSNPDLTPRSHPNPSHRAGHTGLVLRDLACDSLAARRRPCMRLPLMQLSNGPACCCSSCSSTAALPAAAPLVAQ